MNGFLQSMGREIKMRSLNFTLVFLLLANWCIAQDQWATVSIHPKILAGEKVLTIYGKGTFFQQPVSIEQGEVDRSSPRKLSQALFKALNEQNTKLYAEVFNTDPSQITYKPNAQNKFLSMHLAAELYYGDLVILLMNIRLPAHAWTEPYYFKRQGDEYFGMLQAPKDKGIELLKFYFGPGWGDEMVFKWRDRVVTVETTGILATNIINNITNRPMIIEFAGKSFEPGVRVPTTVKPDEAPHVSPESLFEWSVVHSKSNNQDAFLSLVDPSDLQPNASGNSVQSYIKDRLPIASNMLGEEFTITRTIQCHDYALLFYKRPNSDRINPGNWLLTRQIDSQWYLSNALLSDKKQLTLWHPILRYYDLPTTAFPNLVPHAE